MPGTQLRNGDTKTNSLDNSQRKITYKEQNTGGKVLFLKCSAIWCVLQHESRPVWVQASPFHIYKYFFYQNSQTIEKKSHENRLKFISLDGAMITKKFMVKVSNVHKICLPMIWILTL